MFSIIAALIALLFQSGAAATPVQAGTIVRPETTTVGQHFVATIRVRVPSGVRVTFPVRPDSAAQVDSAGAATRTDSVSAGFTESTVSYVLAAWDTGAQRLGLDSVSIATPSGERFVRMDRFQVYVRSVLPRDTALRKPKPFRPVVPVPVFDWMPWLIAAIVAVLCAIAVIVWRNWRRRVARVATPLELAEREFTRIESQNLIESGEPERYAIEMIGVMRVYLASVIPRAMQSATTRELPANLGVTTVVPVDRLVDVLDATDRMKFARERSTAEGARAIGAEARRIVAETAAALAAQAAANAAAKTAAEPPAKAGTKPTARAA